MKHLTAMEKIKVIWKMSVTITVSLDGLFSHPKLDQVDI